MRAGSAGTLYDPRNTDTVDRAGASGDLDGIVAARVPAPAVVPPGPRRAGPIVAGLAGLGAAAAVVATVVGRTVYPHGSVNHDEPMYVFQARLLLRGHLSLPASFAPFRPWASGIREGRVVPKYTPVWPAVLAAGSRLGSMRVGPAFAAAACVVLLAVLGHELFDRWATGFVAAAFLLLSPMFLVQSGTYLPYVFQLALDLAIALLVVASLRRLPRDGHIPRRRGIVAALVAAGALTGVALFARPYDAVLLVAPLACGAAIVLRDRLGALAKCAGIAAAGAALPVAALLACNAVLMGAPLRSTFSVTGPFDKLGFGRRGVFATSAFQFEHTDARISVQRTLLQLPGWTFGGVFVVALACYGLWRHRGAGAAMWSIVAIGASFTAGYAFFWSPYSIVALWSGARTMGPFYHLALLVPLVLLGAAGLVALVERQRLLGAACAAVLVAVSSFTIVTRFERNLEVTQQYRSVERLVDRADLHDAVLFMDDRGESGFESAAPFLENRPSLRQPVIYAVEAGAGDFAVIDRYPSRAIARMRTELRAGDPLLDPTRFVERLRIERGASVTLRVHVVNTTGAALVRSTLSIGSAQQVTTLDTASRHGETYETRWTLHASVLPVATGIVDVGLELTGATGNPDRYRIEIPYRIVDGDLEVLLPGIAQHLFTFGAPQWLNQQSDATFSLLG